MECKIEHGNEKMNARIVLEDLFLKDSALSERRGSYYVCRHSFLEQGRRTPSSSHRSTPAYATVKRGEEMGFPVTGVLHGWDLKGKCFSRTSKSPTPKDHFGVQGPVAREPCDVANTIDSGIEYSLCSSL